MEINSSHNSLSIVIITFNEELVISRLLDSIIDFAQEIIVVDSGSTDKTVEIAEKYNKVKIFYNKFESFGLQKNFAISCATKDIIFILDADEYINQELCVLLSNYNFKEDVIYYLERKTKIWNKFFQYAFGKDYQDRLFIKNNKIRYETNIHERLPKEFKRKKINGLIYHEPSNENAERIFNKQMLYTKLESEEQKNINQSVFWLCIKPFVRFLLILFIRKGILDGKRGLCWAFCSMIYDANVAVRIMEKKYNWDKK